MDPTAVVLMSFVIFMGIAYRFGYHRTMAALDHKIASIRQALEEAAQAKETAEQALNEERCRHGEIHEEINLIAKRAEEQALHLRQQALQELNKIISHRQEAAKEMMERMHATAVQTIREEAAATALASFEDLVTKFTPSQHEALNQEAIAQIVAQLAEGQQASAPKASQPRRTRAKKVGSRAT